MKKAIKVSWLGRLQSVKTAFRKYTHWTRVATWFDPSKKAKRPGA